MEKKLVLALLLACLLGACHCAKVHELCVASDECEGRSLCSNGHCACPGGAVVFDGRCVHAARHGETCREQFECSMSRDPRLQCVEGMCECGRGYGFDGGRCAKERTEFEEIIERRRGERQGERPPYIKLNKMSPQDIRDEVIELESDLDGLFNEPPRHRPLQESRIFGPVCIVLVSLLIFVICMCFWSVRRPEEEYQPRTYFNEKYAVRGKTLEDGLPSAIVATGNGGHMAGHDNPCFQNGNGRTASALNNKRN